MIKLILPLLLAGWYLGSQTTIPHPDIAVDSGFPIHDTSLANTDGTVITSSTFSTQGTNRLLVAVIPYSAGSGDGRQVSSIATTGVTWTRAVFSDHQAGGYGGCEIWTAWASSQLSSVTAVVTFNVTRTAIASFYAFSNASPSLGATATPYNTAGPISGTLTARDGGSWILVALSNRGASSPLNTATAQTIVSSGGDTGRNNSLYVMRSTNATSSAGDVTFSTTDSDATVGWQMAMLEIRRN